MEDEIVLRDCLRNWDAYVVPIGEDKRKIFSGSKEGIIHWAYNLKKDQEEKILLDRNIMKGVKYNPTSKGYQLISFRERLTPLEEKVLSKYENEMRDGKRVIMTKQEQKKVRRNKRKNYKQTGLF